MILKQWKRYFAECIDIFPISIIVLLANSILSSLFPNAIDWIQNILRILLFVGIVCKDCFKPSVGKGIFKLAIYDENGNLENSQRKLLVRNLLTLLFFPIHFIMLIMYNETLTDILTHTYVLNQDEVGKKEKIQSKKKQILEIVVTLIIFIIITTFAFYIYFMNVRLTDKKLIPQIENSEVIKEKVGGISQIKHTLFIHEKIESPVEYKIVYKIVNDSKEVKKITLYVELKTNKIVSFEINQERYDIENRIEP